jgi:hypothetical protein
MKKGTAVDMQFDLARGEGQFVEFKESLDKSFAKEWWLLLMLRVVWCILA